MAALTTLGPQPATQSRFLQTQPQTLTARDVAALTAREIHWMSEAEMVETIRAMRSSHLRPDLAERLPYLDRETLTRLMFLTRRYCQNQRRRQR